MSISYGIPEPCHKCGEKEKLYAVHSFGAEVRCPCGEKGPWMSGNNYQDEERCAVYAWNNRQKSAKNERT